MCLPGEGRTVGEVALTKDDGIRTATVVADIETDLLVVDRALYRRSVRDVLEEEFNQKTDFVDRNPTFEQWTAKQKKQLVISLQKEVMHYGCPLTRQGNPVDNLYFILRYTHARTHARTHIHCTNISLELYIGKIYPTIRDIRDDLIF
jgi:hypothetical protein